MSHLRADCGLRTGNGQCVYRPDLHRSHTINDKTKQKKEKKRKKDSSLLIDVSGSLSGRKKKVDCLFVRNGCRRER